MKKRILVIFTLATILNSCKNKTSISVQVFNPLIQKNVPDAEIALIERKSGGGLFAPSFDCEEIAIALTDAQGRCFFDREKLKRNKKYDYFCVIKKSWDLEQSYTCSGRSSGFVEIGNTNDIVVIDNLAGSFSIQYNNLFNPSVVGDSLVVLPKRLEFANPKGGTVGGGGVSGGGTFVSTGSNNYPASFSNQPDKLSGIIVINIRKRKLGVLTTISDTIIVLPNKLTKAQINW